jgi:uncharacterized protein YjdB
MGKVGSCAIKAVQASNPPATITTSFIVNKGVPTLTNFPDLIKAIVEQSFTITPPTSNSTGSFTYTSSDESVAYIYDNPSSDIIVIVALGTCVITATQAETSNFLSSSITCTLQIVESSSPELSNFPNLSGTYGQAPYLITPPTSTSDGAFTYGSSNTSVVNIDEQTGLVTIVGEGTCTITAYQAPTSSYLAGSIEATFDVVACTPSNPVIIESGEGLTYFLTTTAVYSNIQGEVTVSGSLEASSKKILQSNVFSRIVGQ